MFLGRMQDAYFKLIYMRLSVLFPWILSAAWNLSNITPKFSPTSYLCGQVTDMEEMRNTKLL